MSDDERVLCVPRSALAGIGDFEGWHPDATRYMGELLDDHTATFRPRSGVEDDPSWLQIVAYVILRYHGDIFGYSRGTHGGEGRLSGRWSIGVGGHINDSDCRSWMRWRPMEAYIYGLWRELREELGYEPRGTISRFGVIFDPQDEVGKVHLGFVHILELAEPIHWPAACFATECRMAPPDRWEPGVLESWSRIALQALLAETATRET